MKCLHPNCGMGKGPKTWEAVVDHPDVHTQKKHRGTALKLLGQLKNLGDQDCEITENLPAAYLQRLCEACPCLYTQLGIRVTARGVVHLCEVTLMEEITSKNVYNAFKIQHPKEYTGYRFPPLVSGAAGGAIMEQLCSEVLSNRGIPQMKIDESGWPIWTGLSHLSLNSGKGKSMALYGDILIPAAPHNMLISVKSESARERFVVSGNRLESIGFGFFNDPSEFWTVERMNLIKRWGFVAVYMPKETLDNVHDELDRRGTRGQAININGSELYRPLEKFGDDIKKVAGKISMAL
jgi:hypothetical protein